MNVRNLNVPNMNMPDMNMMQLQYPCMQLFKLAHAYVPFQYLMNIYPPMVGLKQGTVFPELDRPYGADPEYTVDA